MIWIRMICHISIKAFMRSSVSIINKLIQVFGKRSFMDVIVSTRYVLHKCLPGWEPLAVTVTKPTCVCT